MQKNLGTVERLIRFNIALFLALVLMLRGEIDWLTGLGFLATVFLVMNAVSARCYLWRWLGIGRCE
jgi:hypothetical protein